MIKTRLPPDDPSRALLRWFKLQRVIERHAHMPPPKKTDKVVSDLHEKAAAARAELPELEYLLASYNAVDLLRAIKRSSSGIVTLL